MKRRLKEGNFSRRGGFGARGNFQIEQLVALDKEQKKEGVRLNLNGADSSDESGGEAPAPEAEVDSNDELDLAIKERHRALPQQDSESEESEEETVAVGKFPPPPPSLPTDTITTNPQLNERLPAEGAAAIRSDEEDDLMEARKAKRWEKRALSRHRLRRENEDSHSRWCFEDDQESQSLLTMIKVRFIDRTGFPLI